MKISAQGLPNTTTCLFCGDNNPFFELYRGSHSDKQDFFKVYNSDIATDTVHPNYGFFKLSG